MKVEAIHKYEKKMNEDKERIMDRIKELKNEKSSKEEQYIQVREQIKTNETKLKDKVEANSTKMSGLLTKVWDEVAEDIEEELWLNNGKLNEVEAKIRKSLSMCDLKDTCEFFQQVEENEKMFKEDNEVVKIYDAKPIPAFFSGDLKMANLGSLKCSKIPKKLTSINIISRVSTTVLETPNHVLHMVDGSAWIAYKEYVQKYIPKEGTLYPSVQYPFKVVHMCLDQNGDILVCQHGKSVLYKIGKFEISSFLYCNSFNLYPVSICASENLVFMGVVNMDYPQYGRRAVIGTDSCDTVKTSRPTLALEAKKGGTPILVYPLSMAYTKGGDLSVIDGLNHNEGFRVLTWNPSKNRYNYYYGHSCINSVSVRFQPNAISVTPKDNIIVSDAACNTLHILTGDIELMAYVKLNKVVCGKVLSLSCFHDGIHVGTLTPSRSRGSSSATEDRLFTNHVISIEGYSEWF